MAVINKLPENKITDAGIAYVGLGWIKTSTSNESALSNQLYIDNEYFTKNGDTITAQKDFNGIIIIMQGGNSATAQNVIFNPPSGGPGDILATPVGSYTQANCEHQFKAGENLKMYQISKTAAFTAGICVILVN